MDYVIFKKDVYNKDGSLAFNKNGKYRLLSEDDNYYFISPFKKGNQCSQFPKSAEGKVFCIL